MTTGEPAFPATPSGHTGAARGSAGRIGGQRLDCGICGHRIDATDGSLFVTVPCHVRAFLGESFDVWRCPGCRTVHCRNIVDLDRYYARYPFSGMTLTWPFRIFYRNLAHRLVKHGFTKHHSLLDYGCGNGLFVTYLRRRGFVRCHGYDPYGASAGTGDPAILQEGPFDYILLQDVLEHVEDPDALLGTLDAYLAPGGHILVGTPNAANIDLARPKTFLNEIHVPYHLHIYTRPTVEELGARQGWTRVGFFDRPYHDRPWFGLNTRAAKQYQHLVGGTLDAVLEPTRPWKILTSWKFMFYAAFGYWLSFRSDITVVFRKAVPPPSRSAAPRLTAACDRGP